MEIEIEQKLNLEKIINISLNKNLLNKIEKKLDIEYPNKFICLSDILYLICKKRYNNANQQDRQLFELFYKKYIKYVDYKFPYWPPQLIEIGIDPQYSKLFDFRQNRTNLIDVALFCLYSGYKNGINLLLKYSSEVNIQLYKSYLFNYYFLKLEDNIIPNRTITETICLKQCTTSVKFTKNIEKKLSCIKLICNYFPLDLNQCEQFNIIRGEQLKIIFFFVKKRYLSFTRLFNDLLNYHTNLSNKIDLIMYFLYHTFPKYYDQNNILLNQIVTFIEIYIQENSNQYITSKLFENKDKYNLLNVCSKPRLFDLLLHRSPTLLLHIVRKYKMEIKFELLQINHKQQLHKDIIKYILLHYL